LTEANTKIQLKGSALREHRARIAERLLQHADALHAVVEWTDLDRLPDWCALTDNQLQDLITKCGVVAYAKPMEKIIDGRVLRDYFSLAGSSINNNPDTEGFDNLPVPEVDNLKHCIDSAGVAILLSAAGDSPCLAALASSMPCQPLTELELSQDRSLKFLEKITQTKTEDSKDTDEKNPAKADRSSPGAEEAA